MLNISKKDTSYGKYKINTYGIGYSESVDSNSIDRLSALLVRKTWRALPGPIDKSLQHKSQTAKARDLI